MWVCGGVLRSGGGVGGGDVQNDGIDDKFMQLFDASCNFSAKLCCLAATCVLLLQH